jgi:hypothetical protein
MTSRRSQNRATSRRRTRITALSVPLREVAIRKATSARQAGQLDSRLDARPGNVGGEAYSRGEFADSILNGMPLPENDPNGTRERAAANIRLHATADITVKDSHGREIGRASPNLMQMPGAPVPAGASGSW